MQRKKIDPSYFPLFRVALQEAIRAQDGLTVYFEKDDGEGIFPKALPSGDITCECAIDQKEPLVTFFVRFTGVDVTFEITFDVDAPEEFTGQRIGSLFTVPRGPWVVSGAGINTLEMHDWNDD